MPAPLSRACVLYADNAARRRSLRKAANRTTHVRLGLGQKAILAAFRISDTSQRRDIGQAFVGVIGLYFDLAGFVRYFYLAYFRKGL